jgi:hypothetical protein
MIRNPLTWSFLAVVISVIAVILAFSAFARAGSDGEGLPTPSDSASATVAPTSVSDGGPTTTDEPTETKTVDPDEPVNTQLPSPGASYSPYKQDVKVRLTGGGGSRYVDLDEPLVNAASDASDLVFQTGFAQPKLVFSSDDVAVGKSAVVTPDECAQEIQLAPTNRSVDVSQDLVLCAVTNGLGAVNEPARSKMARIVINSVSKDDSVNLTITTWEIPH